jgi:putative thioredoxin
MHFASVAPAAGEIPALQARLEQHPKDSEARYRLAIASVMAGDYGAAMDGLLGLMMRDRDYGGDAARQALLRLFDMLGDDPLVAQARRRMFNLLH